MSRIVAECVTQEPDLKPERVVAHDRVTPHTVEDGRFGDDLTRMPRKQPESRERLGRQPQFVIVVIQGAVRSLEAEGTEMQCLLIHQYVKRSSHLAIPLQMFVAGVRRNLVVCMVFDQDSVGE